MDALIRINLPLQKEIGLPTELYFGVYKKTRTTQLIAWHSYIPGPRICSWVKWANIYRCQERNPSQLQGSL